MRATRLTLLPLTLWLLSGASMAATVYKWVDAQGITHYSDQPHPQAQEIDVKPVNTYSSPPVAASNSSTSTGPAAPAYRTCELIRPENDEVFLNTSTISARLGLDPQLIAGDQVAIAVDGKRVTGQPTTGTEFVIPDIARGTHTLTIVVYDRTGKEQRCSTPAVTFHVRQPSVQAPVKAVRPRF
jgi:uncharacterized protein DUF4124